MRHDPTDPRLSPGPSCVPLLLAFALALALPAGGAIAVRSPRVSVILISIDTLRADHLSCYGYRAARTASIDALATDGVLFDDHLSTVPLTLPSHSAMLTGLSPPHTGVHDNGGFYLSESVTTLAESFRAAGYRTGGFVGAFVLDRRWGIAQGFDTYYDDFDVVSAGDVPIDFIQRRAADVIAKAREFLAGPQPLFCFIHLYDPHTPYEPPAAFRAATPFPLYDGEIAYVDSEIGRLVSWLKSNGLYDSSIIVLTSDHGESLGEHGEATHGFFVYRSTLHVPLIVKLPSKQLAGTRRSDLTSSVDIAPTILGALGQRFACDGIDLFRTKRSGMVYSETFYPRYHYNWSELLSVTGNGMHYIEAPRREAYRYGDDPLELRNIYPARDQASFDAELDRLNARRLATPQQVDQETIERLRSLGYTGGDLPSTAGPLADPKDKIASFNRLKQAEDLVYRDQGEKALALLRDLEHSDPKIPAIYNLMGSLAFKQGRWTDAAREYSKALAIVPDDMEAIFGRGLAARRDGKPQDARADLERLIVLDPRNNKALFQLAEIASEQGRNTDAVGLLDRAISQGHELAPLYGLLFKCLHALGRDQEAAEALRKGLAADPALPLAHFNLAVLGEARGDAADAEKEYRAEMGQNPKNEMALFNLARLLERSPRPAGEAIDLYRRAIAAKPDFAAGYIYLARALMDNATTLQESYYLCSKGLAVASDQQSKALAHFVLADICNRMGRSEEAQRELEAGRRLSGGR